MRHDLVFSRKALGAWKQEKRLTIHNGFFAVGRKQRPFARLTLVPGKGARAGPRFFEALLGEEYAPSMYHHISKNIAAILLVCRVQHAWLLAPVLLLRCCLRQLR